MENLSSADEKIITIQSNFEYSNASITQDNIFMEQMPYITCKTAGDYDALLLKQQVYWDKILPMYLANPAIPEVSKLIAQRMQARSYKKTPNEINVMFPLTNAERIAIKFVNMISIDITPKSILDYPTDYYPTFRVYIQKADDTPAKKNVLAALQVALQEVPAAPVTPPAMQEMTNSAANINMSTAAGKTETPPNR